MVVYPRDPAPEIYARAALEKLFSNPLRNLVTAPRERRLASLSVGELLYFPV